MHIQCYTWLGIFQHPRHDDKWNSVIEDQGCSPMAHNLEPDDGQTCPLIQEFEISYGIAGMVGVTATGNEKKTMLEAAIGCFIPSQILLFILIL